MRQLRALARRLLGLFRWDHGDTDFASELESHIALDTEAGVRNGLTPEEARRQALVRLGGVEQARQAYRERQTLPWVETLVQDARYALRMMAHNRGFTAVAVLTLAIGIGASTAIFSAVKPILIDPLPYPQARRLMLLWEMRKSGAPMPVTFGTFHGLSQRTAAFEGLAVFKPWEPAATATSAADRPERITGQRVSADYFRVLGIAPLQGRDFEATDDRFRGPNVVILSDSLWRRRFAGDVSVVGRQVRFDGELYTVIGVMPHGFENVVDPSAEVWAPLQYDPSLPFDGREWGHHLRMIGRIKAGISAEQAGSEMTAAVHSLAQTYAKGYDSSGGAPDGIVVHPLQHDLTQGVRPALLAVLGAVLLVLLIACVNVANLLLARGSQRRAEFAMRVALGAPRGRIARQLVTECLLLAICGGVLGMAIAEAGARGLVVLSPPGLPRVNAISVDANVFVFALVLTTLIGIVVGLVSNLQAAGADLNGATRQGPARTTNNRNRTRRALVVTEVSLAVVLLVSAGLLLRSMQHLFAVDPGFDTTHLITMQVQSVHRYGDDAARLESYRQTLDKIRSMPGVVSAGLTSQLPLSGDQDVYGIQFEISNKPQGESAYRYAVSPDYLETMHIPLRKGRMLNERDTTGTPVAVLITQSLADRIFAGADPIGQRVRIGPDIGRADRPWATIVGVVGNIRQESLALTNQDAFYITTAQWAWGDGAQSVVARTQGAPALLASSIEQTIWSVDKDCVISRVDTMDSLLGATAVQRRFVLILFEGFGLVALLLASIGIYGILAGSVTERTREIGVRAALGATRADILALVLRQGMTMTGTGVAIGLGAALLAARSLDAMLFGVTWLDGATYLGATVVLFALSGVACFIPARRAASIDPMQALRTE